MIAADSSSVIAYFEGKAGNDVTVVQTALAGADICLPPVVLAEILSDKKSHAALRRIVSQWPLLEILPEYWERAGWLRANLIDRGLKPKLPDTLIAQSCIDHGVALITRDAGFEHFARHGGLKLA